VRVEDLDSSRVRPGIEEAQLSDLRALGLDWDGPVVRQSERMGLYEEAIERLDANGLLYPCYCTRAEIRAAACAPHGISTADRYPGTCRDLTAAQRAEREAAGRPPALRVRSEDARIAFEDRLLGCRDETLDDFVMRRNDGTPAYQLAVVVDDAAQGIGEVVRGADLADSTPRQILLARLLGLPEARYAHVPLVLGPDGRRLAKRHDAVTLSDRSEIQTNYALGWHARSASPRPERRRHPATSSLVSNQNACRASRASGRRNRHLEGCVTAHGSRPRQRCGGVDGNKCPDGIWAFSPISCIIGLRGSNASSWEGDGCDRAEGQVYRRPGCYRWRWPSLSSWSGYHPMLGGYHHSEDR
jgi:glutamyl-tRNA synthetase